MLNEIRIRNDVLVLEVDCGCVSVCYLMKERTVKYKVKGIHLCQSVVVFSSTNLDGWTLMMSHNLLFLGCRFV